MVRLKLWSAPEIVTIRSANDALRDWVTNVRDTFYCIGTVAGPHPYPAMVRDFQSIIGKEARAQMQEAEGRLPDRHGYRGAGVGYLETALETIGRTHRDRTHDTVTELVLHLEDQIHGIDLQCIVYLRHRSSWELDIHDGADNLNDFTRAHWRFLLAALTQRLNHF